MEKYRHTCGVPEWPICCVCGGRIHQHGCTSKPNWQRDCCDARHKALYDAGYPRGIDDSSQATWNDDPMHRGYARTDAPENPEPGLPEGFPRPKEY